VLQRGLLFLMVAFPVSELVLAVAKRARAADARREDRGSMGLLWLVIGLGLAAAFLCRRVAWGRLPGSPDALRIVACALLAGGLALRWTAIVTLGRFFTVDVAIRADHRVVQAGVYRRIRHPSYSGLLLAFAGLGVATGSWLSLLALLGPITAAVMARIGVEERALAASLGPEYEEYRRRTRRLVPGLV
jgi:protein-S-isoprenylcysteine O-methyltransferase